MYAIRSYYEYGLKGPLGAPVTACAASVQAIGDAARLIRCGEADIAVCGGTEATIDRVSLGGFAAARALSSSFTEHPDQASRPFDTERDGFVMGEGAGILVIESLEHALARGAKPIAELVGYGTSADAYHLTAGPEDGDGAKRSMQAAIQQAGISPSEIQHLNAHATSTPVGDKGELRITSYNVCYTKLLRTRHFGVPNAYAASRNVLGTRRNISSVVRTTTGITIKASAIEPAQPENVLVYATTMAYTNRPITIDGAESRMSLINRVMRANADIPPYSDKNTPAISPNGVTIIVPANVIKTEP